MNNNEIIFTYKNWKGITSVRRIDKKSIVIKFSESEFHKEDGEQWIMDAYDLDKNDFREFAIKDIVGYIELDFLKNKIKM